MKKAWKICILFIVVIIIIIIVYLLLKKNYEYHKYDANKIEYRKEFDPSNTLRYFLEGKNIESRNVSESFKNKYKVTSDIIPEINDYSWLGNGYSVVDGKRCICIDAHKPDNIINAKNEEPYVVFYFEYKVTNNNLLDDVKLVKISYREQMTGREIDAKLID